MGRDKALIEVDGRAMARIATDALAEAGAAEVFVVGGDRSELERLGLRVVDDLHPGEGPLGGIITGLSEAANAVVAVLACDHPYTEAPAVRSVVGALGEGDVVIPVVEGRRQTLHAAWNRRVLGHLEDAFGRGARSVVRGIEGLSVVELLDGDPCWFGDADIPSDLP